MVYNTKFYKIGMFERFILSGTTYMRVGKNLYKNITTGTVSRISRLGVAVKQVENEYAWHT